MGEEILAEAASDEVVDSVKSEEAKKDDLLVAARQKFRIKQRPSEKDKMRLEVVLDVEWDDPEDGVTKKGVFSAKRPGIGALGRISVLEAQANGGQEASLSQPVLYIHRALAYCAVVLQKAPQWWAPEGLFDADPVIVLYEHLRAAWSAFRRPGVGE